MSSGLLSLTWNKVITDFTKLKKIKYWQALLVLTTIAALCAPCYYRSRARAYGGKPCLHSKCCHEKDGNETVKKECPYSKNKEGQEEKEE